MVNGRLDIGIDTDIDVGLALGRIRSSSRAYPWLSSGGCDGAVWNQIPSQQRRLRREPPAPNTRRPVGLFRPPLSRPAVPSSFPTPVFTPPTTPARTYPKP